MVATWQPCPLCFVPGKLTSVCWLSRFKPHPYKTFTDQSRLSQPLAAMAMGKSYINCLQDTAMPHSLPHPRLSERLSLFRLLECMGSHELCFIDPQRLAQAIEQAGRD